MDNKVNIETLTVEQVVSVYSGKAGKCCCGCAGKHRYPAAKRAEASKSRGYPVRDNEINDRQVSKVLNLVKEHAGKEGIETTTDETYASVEVDGRMYTVYVA